MLLCDAVPNIYAPSGDLCTEAQVVASGPGPITRSTLLDEATSARSVIAAISSMLSCQLSKGDARQTSRVGGIPLLGGLVMGDNRWPSSQIALELVTTFLADGGSVLVSVIGSWRPRACTAR
jgi:hypothetical protein